MTSAALLAFLSLAPAAAQIEPPSGIRVVVSSASVAGLDCRRRPFAWENTKATGRWYKHAAGQMFTEGLDLRPIVAGAVSAVVAAPVLAASVPADLAAAPFRRSCSFTLRLEGRLAQWAGMNPGALSLEAEAVNLLSPEVEGVKEAEFAVFRASTTAADDGAWALSIPGGTARYKALGVAWRVDGKPAGQHLLNKRGKRFILSEPDPGFGVGAAEMSPMAVPVR